MTGEVPYYGGRMSPAQATAAQHARRQPASTASPVAAPMAASERVAMLEQLHDDGTLTDEEFRSLSERIDS